MANKISGKRGRPKGKPLSRLEDAQRKKAAYRHGRYAEGRLSLATPCKKSHCPLKFPCDVKKERDARGEGTVYCFVDTPSEPPRDICREAVRKLQMGEPAEYDALVGDLVGDVFALMVEETRRLFAEGNSVTSYATKPDGNLSKDEDGQPIARRVYANPRARELRNFMKVLGLTGIQQKLTPKTRSEADGEGKVNEFLAEVAEGLELLQGKSDEPLEGRSADSRSDRSSE